VTNAADVVHVDSTTPVDSGGGDAHVTDAGVDANDIDAFDGNLGPLDASGFDAPAIQDFPHVVNQLVCQRLGECCAIDGGAPWDQQGCENAYNGSVGFEYVGEYFPFPNDASTVTYDMNLATQCMAAARNIPCGIVSAAQLLQFRENCLNAVQGTLAQGANCKSTVECASGYCNLDPDAGKQCVALQGIGGACGFNFDEACTPKAIGVNPGNWCAPADGGGYACAPQLGVDASCFEDQTCSTGVCDFPDPNTGMGLCGNQYVLSDPGVVGGLCDSFSIKDAGGGG
jgi:hypothetical protein